MPFPAGYPYAELRTAICAELLATGSYAELPGATVSERSGNVVATDPENGSHLIS
jgi:hypothetical protein